ncbi:energy-coupling factor ABC transporter permease [Clostridium sp. D2Q-11]|uniref:Cobalt transport protein CbiM n=1 Tax=Anaeromonas frigoriresistens TaxID=2683708 RepID=A0A942UW12_9FIRM|nr:energy-coupling factor ABC transporter permease [Anaeromonas frigoriresistens]MBS4538555.1 energy-coupling factor ABC transporter permease [Anaeromonas frigoriresistens]
MKKKYLVLIGLVLMFMPRYANAMHIMEGYLSPFWAGFWTIVSLPFVIVGFRKISKIVKENGNKKILIALMGAFVFVLSALKLPSITGSSSHPTGVGLGAIVLGPVTMSVIGMIVLLFQALLLAHGGITTLGANTFSMGIVGPFVAFGIYKLSEKIGWKKEVSIFLAASLGNLATYTVTSFQLAVAHAGASEGVMQLLVKFLSIFAITQIPLAIAEGILSVIVYNLISQYKDEGVLAYEKNI